MGLGGGGGGGQADGDLKELTAGAAPAMQNQKGLWAHPILQFPGSVPVSYFLGTFEFAYQTKIIRLFNK